MSSENWSLTAKLCDSCKTTSATVFCRADSAFLCLGCDCKIHAANKLASRHARVWVCEVCEQAPASVTCKADAAALCVTCDRDIHSANPLARRHERFPVVPFYDSAVAKSHGGVNDDEKYFDSHENNPQPEEEAEAASWILPTPKEGTDNQYKSADYLFNDMDSYLDMDIMSCDQKPHNILQLHQQYCSDGVVPVQNKNESSHLQGPVVDGFPTYEMDFIGSKPYLYNFNSQSISQSVSSSSMDVGVVPEHSAMADVSNSLVMNSSADTVANAVSGLDREARVLRYREKRKNRKFEKTIRYASRKAYAETRPRIKGRFAKRTEIEVDSLLAADASYGVVPSF
ncbi:zinc finger protein CONSTANS-LIKE 3-like [Nicotiana tabacum]|uniref:Zinc finger protein CONSTANS-LIKE 3-like n=2 Tax=Nicotiana TaxID=4085 RepID=A0A1S4AP33_TOBAC|nr:PREDICTED: zinc finger protein CONSTANS-LIKE 4-like [Nicotiana sylvestris]XP_016478497.1 PREDICTED: zinc finger protein CONSTANS-LIKE 4-like [Nicotiana tabacum]